MSTLRRISCAAARDRAPFFVLGALDAREAAEVREHLATCPEPHPEYLELGGVVPYLAELVEPVDGGPELRRRVMDAIAADVRAQTRDDQAAERLIASFGAPSPTAPAPAPKPTTPAADTTLGLDGARTDRPPTLWADEPASRPAVTPTRQIAGSSWTRGRMPDWIISAAAVLLIVVLGAWNVGLQLQAGDTARRADELRVAVALAAEPGARIAQLAGTEAAPGASGFAAFAADGTGAMVVRGLPPAASDKTYQAWFLKSSGPVSAGLVRVEKDGLLVITGLRPGGAVDGMALSLEATGGASDAQGPQGPIVVAPSTA